MAAFVFARLLAIVAFVALLGSACADDGADPAEAMAVAASEAAGVVGGCLPAHKWSALSLFFILLCDGHIE